MELEFLKKAMDNENNVSIYDETNASIRSTKMKVFSQFDLSPNKIKELLDKLKTYRYVDDINNFRQGAYIRWVYIGEEENDNEFFDNDDENFHLNKGAVFCDTKIDVNGIFIICKTTYNKYYQFPLTGDYLFFQKISAQEQTILNTIDALSGRL